MGFLAPWSLLALPLALLPLLLDWSGRRVGRPVRFSSLYLLERARASARTPTRSRWALLLRCLAILLLVLAAARPVGPGRGDPALHRPTRAIVAVDVSGSVDQRVDGRPAWEAIAAAADSLLAAAGPDDRVALAAFADGLVEWWEEPPAALRARLRVLGPTARASDWPAALAALAGRAEDGTETYLLTDGARGARAPAAGPAGDGAAERRIPGRVALRVLPGTGEPNRALSDAAWPAADRVALAGRAWGPGAPGAAEAGRALGERVADAAPIPLSGATSGGWDVADTATFALVGGDPRPSDDRLRVARGGAGGAYRVIRWAPGDEPAEPGGLFWEAALAAAPRGARVERTATLAALAAAAPDLAILPLRAYRADEAALLGDLAAGGTRLLFAPACPAPACAPPPGWLPDPRIPAPDLAWRLGPADRQTALAPRPEGPAAPAAAVPEHLLARTPVRGALAATGARADWAWPLASGAPALWVAGPVAVWLVPLGPPVTRLGATPVFPLLADAALGAWDPRWSAGGTGLRVGAAIPVPAEGATVAGPLHAGPAARTWSVAPGAPGPRPEAPGLYRVLPASDGTAPAGTARFVAVNADPAEGDLRPIAPAAWEAATGVRPVDAVAWRAAWFPRRRGPDWTPWLLALAVAALAGEAAVRRRAATATTTAS